VAEYWQADQRREAGDTPKKKNMTRVITILAGAAIAAGLLSGMAARCAAADQQDYFAFGAGVFDLFDDETAGELRAEYRSDLRLWLIYPFLGAMVNTDGGLYGYGGLALDIPLGDRFILTPNIALGAYHDGSGKDLGGTLEFRTGAEFAYRFDNDHRLGLAFHHISNASIYDVNPGTESLVVMYALPLGGP
jgi:hypothetical protein